MVRIVGITANPARPAALECAADLAARLAARGVEVRVQATVACLLRVPAAEDEELGRADLLVAVGGDGTLLAAAEMVHAGLDAPIGRGGAPCFS